MTFTCCKPIKMIGLVDGIGRVRADEKLLDAEGSRKRPINTSEFDAFSTRPKRLHC